MVYGGVWWCLVVWVVMCDGVIVGMCQKKKREVGEKERGKKIPERSFWDEYPHLQQQVYHLFHQFERFLQRKFLFVVPLWLFFESGAPIGKIK